MKTSGLNANFLHGNEIELQQADRFMQNLSEKMKRKFEIQSFGFSFTSFA